MSKVTINHPNGRGTGSAMSCEAHWAHDDMPGFMRVTVARQSSISMPVVFDWENAITFDLNLSDLGQFILVFRGMRESIMDGKGIYHRTTRVNEIIKFSHQIEPRPGYLLEVNQKPTDGEQSEAHFIFMPEDAVCFLIALEGAIPFLTFGKPTTK